MLWLYRKGGTARAPVGKIWLQVEKIDDETAADRARQNANAVISKREADRQLKANTLRGKVWLVLGKLDSLSGIIGKIDQLAKVGCCNCTANSLSIPSSAEHIP